MQWGCSKLSLGLGIGAGIQKHGDGHWSDLSPYREMQRCVAVLTSSVKVGSGIQQRLEYPGILADRGRVMQRSDFALGTRHRVRAGVQTIVNLYNLSSEEELGRVPVSAGRQSVQVGVRSIRCAQT